MERKVIQMKHNSRLVKILFVIGLLLTGIPPAVSAQEEVINCEHPRVVYLVEKTGTSCQEIVDLVESGIGYGQIMKAVVISESMPEGSAVDWRELLEAHLAGAGWGQISKAYGLQGRFEILDLTPEAILELRESGLGWGQIVHAKSLASADIGLSFEEAVAMLQGGMGWGEIRTELGLESGPPPWAGQDKAKNGQGIGNNGNGNGQGKPPWAGQGNGAGNGNGQGNSSNDDD
jgi:hypothetical protein